MDLPAFSQAPATWCLLLVTVVVSFYAFQRPHVVDRLVFDVGAILRKKEDDRLITSGFLHGDVMHLLINMLTLISFGPYLESVLGSWRFLALYLGSMIIASLTMLYAKSYNLTYRALGASGATCGVVFAFCLFAPFASINVMFAPIGIPAWLYAIVFVIYSSVATGSGGNVAHEAHIGGSVGGALLMILMEPAVLGHFFGALSGG